MNALPLCLYLPIFLSSSPFPYFRPSYRPFSFASFYHRFILLGYLAPFCSLLRPRDASKNPDQCSFSESQSSGSKQLVILGWPLILSSPGRLTSTRWERRQLKDWGCLVPSLTGEAACPSETAFCTTSSSSVLWWITHVRSGGPLPAATSGSCKCYKTIVFALVLWYVSNRQIHEDLGISFFADHIRALTDSFDSKLADAGNPLVRKLGRHLCRPRADWRRPRITEADWCSAGQPRLSLKMAAKSAQRVVSNNLATLTEVFRAFPQLQDKCQGIIQKGHGPPSPIMEAFIWNDSPQVSEAISQSDPNTLGSTPRAPSNQNHFQKGQFTWWVNVPPEAIALF
jgi:hypothetical protein